MKYILIALTLFSLNSFAEQEYSCIDQAALYGDAKGHDKITEECIQDFKSNASIKAIKENKEKDIKVYGYKNMIIVEKHIEDKTKNMVTAGKNTLVNNIIALELDENNNEIIVLDESGDILFFSSIITGNIA